MVLASGSRCIALVLLLLLLIALDVDAARNYYQILGVPQTASIQQIKRAYKKQAMRWHPDKHQKDKERATSKFQEIAEAYEVLSDNEKRKVYDLGGEDAVKGKPQSSPGKDARHSHFAGAQTNVDPAMFEAIFRSMSGMSSSSFKASGAAGTSV
jgi:DnaJ family protein B protein 4